MRTFVIRKNGGGFRFLGLAGAWAALGAFAAACGLRAAFPGAFGLGGLLRCGRGDGGELGEEWLEDVVVDVFAADLQAFEEGLVEEAALGCVGLAVGGLDVVGEVEREVEGAADIVGLDFVAAEQFVGGDALAANPHLLLGEEVVADLVAVVGGEQLSFLVGEPGDLSAGAVGLGFGEGGDAVDASVDGGTDALSLGRGELDGGVVALDCVLDCFGAVVGLVAGLAVASAADEVVVFAAVATGAHEKQSAGAVGAEDRAAQVVVVAPAALAGLTLCREDLLHLLEGFVVDERLVAALVGGAGVVDEPDVVVVAQQAGEPV